MSGRALAYLFVALSYLPFVLYWFAVGCCIGIAVIAIVMVFGSYDLFLRAIGNWLHTIGWKKIKIGYALEDGWHCDTTMDTRRFCGVFRSLFYFVVAYRAVLAEGGTLATLLWNKVKKS